MENTSLTIFSDAFVVDSTGFNDKNYVNVNAHELAHQWFGDLVTATSGEHHWLQEGFATYYALLAEKEVFGQDYFDFKLYNSAQDLKRQDLAGNGTSLLNPKSSSLTFYQRGAWVLYALRDKVGDIIFRDAVKSYLEKYQYANVKTSDFISEVETRYEKPLTEFVSKWIEANEFAFNDAVALLKERSSFIQEYVMVDCEANSSKCEEYLKYYVSDDAKVKVISQRPDLVSVATFSESLKVRQAISQFVTKIPSILKDNYETLLEDKSYLTIESALYNLWVNFPQERSKYLSKTKNIHGFNDKNVRLLWLVLALNTLEFQPENNNAFLKELMGYTGASQNFELRMNAFTYLDLIKACDADCQSNLEQAKTHHNWRMVKFAKDMSQKLKKQ
jgi:aminopeptidase N